MKPIRLMRGFLTVGLWTLLSRLLGFVRDIMIAAYLGAGPVAEAYLIAFSLPNMFRRFFAEGAFNMAFVPMFSKKLEAGEDAQSFARDAFAGLATTGCMNRCVDGHASCAQPRSTTIRWCRWSCDVVPDEKLPPRAGWRSTARRPLTRLVHRARSDGVLLDRACGRGGDRR